MRHVIYWQNMALSNQIEMLPKREELERLSKAELIEAVISAYQDSRSSVEDVKENTDATVANKEADSIKDPSEKSPEKIGKKRKKRSNQDIDYSQFVYRRIALKLAYFGWNYGGFSSNQEEGGNTVEDHLIRALKECRLVESVDNKDYNKCGRTDKGVSSLGQVVSLTVRSRLPHDHPDAILGPNFTVHASNNKKKSRDEWSDSEEFPYDSMLNRVLPRDIRVLSWCRVDKDFSARFNCKARLYKYFFPRGHLDIDKMRDAAQYLLGAHDFRNFCRLDHSKGLSQTFDRSVHSISIDQWETCKPPDDPDCLFAFTIEGSAFLLHQVRYTMSVLLLVGEGKEEPEVVRDMLDIEKCPEKPEYPIASPTPLVLWECKFDPKDALFVGSEGNYLRIHELMQDYWREEMSKTNIIHSFFQRLMKTDHASLVTLASPDQTGNAVVNSWDTVCPKDFYISTKSSNQKRVPLMRQCSNARVSLQERMQRNEAKKLRKAARKSAENAKNDPKQMQE